MKYPGRIVELSIVLFSFSGSVVMANLWSTTHNEEIFKDSFTFKADRFLDDEGKFSKPDAKDFAPFSAGKVL